MTFFGIVGLFSLSLILGLAVIAGARRYNVGADSAPGVQRFHTHWVPRLGGVPIFIALALWILVAVEEIQPDFTRCVYWVLCLVPAFAGGLLEDVTRKVGSWPRLAATMIGAAMAWFLLDVQVVRLGLAPLDNLLAATPFLSLAITMLFVGGAAHAVNIIDGYNGLAASYALTVLFAVLVAAGRVGDVKLLYMSVGAIAAVLGFFVLNFPYGRMFLGDSGAYLIGTLIAFMLTTLVRRHEEISPMFAAVLLVYPVWETLFSMYRKKILRNQSPMEPDGVHLHMLVHKRLVRSYRATLTGRSRILMNSATTLYAFSFNIATAIFAMLAWTNTFALAVAFAVFIASYLVLYSSLVRFRIPNRLSMRPLWSDDQVAKSHWLARRIQRRARIPGVERFRAPPESSGPEPLLRGQGPL